MHEFELKLNRREPQDIIDIGLVVEEALRGPMGVILKALTNGRIAGEVIDTRHKDEVNADRILGRIEAYAILNQDLEQFIIDKDKQIAALRKKQEREESPEEVFGAEEPR